MGEIRSIVKQVLSQLGTSREARYYLNQYSEDSLHFAVIKVGGALVERELDALASALAFLRNLGLMPIILHGAGPQLDAALASRGRADGKARGSARHHPRSDGGGAAGHLPRQPAYRRGPGEPGGAGAGHPARGVRV
jgi:acetylglutamate synthase